MWLHPHHYQNLPTPPTSNQLETKPVVKKQSSTVQKSIPRNTTTFKGGIDELKSFFYDCASYKDADRFITTTKAISEHVGRTYGNPGDIRDTLDNMKRFEILVPIDPSCTWLQLCLCLLSYHYSIIGLYRPLWSISPFLPFIGIFGYFHSFS